MDVNAGKGDSFEFIFSSSVEILARKLSEASWIIAHRPTLAKYEHRKLVKKLKATPPSTPTPSLYDLKPNFQMS